MVELGQRQMQQKPNGSGGLSTLVDELLELIEAEADQDRHPATTALHQQIQRFRLEIARDVDAASRSGAECVDACGQFMSARRAHQVERETGLRSLIDLLREGLATVAADTGSFQSSLLTASDRMSALIGVEDLRTLKQRLTQEVGQIKRVVAEKQKQDEKLQAQLTQRIDSLEATLAETQVAATIDPVTQVANRRQLDATLTRWMEDKGRRRFVLVLIDIDQFKTINDTLGHPAGDCALVGTARILTSMVRPGDLVARYGGDEFALLLVNMTLELAELRLPQIVARIAQAEFPYEKDGLTQKIRCTISCGLAQSGRNDTIERLIARADDALYAAKQQGRNRAVSKRASLWQSLVR